MNKKTVVNSKHAPAPIGPYSQAIWAGDLLFVSGQVAIDPLTNEMIDNDISAETRQVMNNLKAIIEEAGITLDHIIKCSIFVSDMDNFSLINDVYGEYFSHQPPARETVEVRRLPRDVNVEISCIAQR